MEGKNNASEEAIPSEITTITIDLKKLELAYKTAVIDNKESFVYDNQEVLTSYAKYLIEYLKLKKK